MYFTDTVFYGNEKGLKLFLRKTFYKLANANVLYERRAKKIMVSKGFKPERLHVMFNSLDYDTHKELRKTYQSLQKEEVFHFFTDSKSPIFIFVGRLTKIKKINMIIEAMSRLNELGLKNNLLIIGDGIEKSNLENLAAKLLTKGSYYFYGALYDESLIGKYLSVADLCISPGNVGLTAIHSLSFGTPVCTHNNFENQMPEVEALEDGKTGVFFEENNLEDLVDKLKAWSISREKNKEELRKTCFKIIDDYYNPYYQESVIENIINNGQAMV